MTDKEALVANHVRYFEARHYASGKGPTKAEISMWCTRYIQQYKRDVRRAIEKAIIEAMSARYGSIK